jgi:hypothetical protein
VAQGKSWKITSNAYLLQLKCNLIVTLKILSNGDFMKIKVIGTTVIIDGFEFEGFIDEEQYCNVCGINQIYFDKYDAYFCPKCNHWLENKCGDQDCNYCPNRPDLPLTNN